MTETKAFLIGAMMSPLAFWLGGYNFDERGDLAVACALLFLAFGAFGVIGFKLWEAEND